MRLTVVGSGDAFAAGGRFNTCFRLETGTSSFLIDCGASTLVALRRMGIDPATLDGVILSHLHGDHFGGLPFLFLEAQYVSRRTRPFIVAGPPGTQERLAVLIETLYPGATRPPLRFDWQVIEIEPGTRHALFGASVLTTEVEHPSGAPSTAIRVEADGRTFGYSGDTQWTDALLSVADGADLFMVECYAARPGVPFHIDWPTLQARRADLKARRIMVTHMGPDVLALIPHIEAAGLEVAADGLVTDV